MELIFYVPMDVILPLLPLSYNVVNLFFTGYGNAFLICLFEVLRKSKTKYDDVGNDQFDYEAPPPMKEVLVSKSLHFYFLSIDIAYHLILFIYQKASCEFFGESLPEKKKDPCLDLLKYFTP